MLGGHSLRSLKRAGCKQYEDVIGSSVWDRSGGGGLRMPGAWHCNEVEFRLASPPTIVFNDLHPERRYAKRHLVKLQPNGMGPFCTFVVPDLTAVSGVYAFVLEVRSNTSGAPRTSRSASIITSISLRANATTMGSQRILP